MQGEEEGGGLNEATILAAYAIQNDQDARRSSTSSVGSAGGYYTATSAGGSVGGGASFRSLSSAFGSGRWPPSPSSGVCACMGAGSGRLWRVRGHIQSGSDCSDFCQRNRRRPLTCFPLQCRHAGSPTMSPPSSPTKRSPLGRGPRDRPNLPQASSPPPPPPVPAATAAAALGSDEWQQLHAIAQRSPSNSLTLREQYQQYQVLAAGGSPEEQQSIAGDGESDGEEEQQQEAGEEKPAAAAASAAESAGQQSAEGWRRAGLLGSLPPPLEAAEVPITTGLRSRHSTAAGLEHSVSWGADPSAPPRRSSAFPPPRVTLRRATMPAFAPADPGQDAASLAAAGAAAAAAMQQQLAAGEQYRRAALAADEERQAEKHLRQSIGILRRPPLGEEGLDKVAEEGPEGSDNGGAADEAKGDDEADSEASGGDEVSWFWCCGAGGGCPMRDTQVLEPPWARGGGGTCLPVFQP